MPKYNPYALYRLAVLNCNHCGKELCLDTRGSFLNENEDKAYKALTNIKSIRCSCCYGDIGISKSNIDIFKEPIDIRLWNKSR